MKKIFFLLVLTSCASNLFSQEILKKYIATGFTSNLNAQQYTTDYEKALWGLKEAKRLYAPNVDFVASYSHLFRKPYEFDIDPSNPIMSGLLDFVNALDISSIKDGKIYYPAPDQYSAGVQLTQTVFNRELAHNNRIKEANIRATKAQLEDFKIELEAEIQSAYFQYLQAHFIKESILQALELSQRNLRNIEILIANQKATKDALYRAKANVSDKETLLRNAENAELKAGSYFNFLLNSSLDTPIEIDQYYIYDQSGRYELQTHSTSSFDTEYRLSYLRSMIDMTSSQQGLIKANRLPKIQFGAAALYKGRTIDFERGQNYIAQLQVSLKWNLFNSGINNAKYKQAEFQLSKLNLQYEQQEKSLALQEINSLNDVITELNNYSSVKDSYNNANVYYDAVEQKFFQGMASILELTDAEGQLLQATVNNQMWYYQVLAKTAQYKKATGKTIEITIIK